MKKGFFFAHISRQELTLYIIKCLSGCFVAFAISHFLPTYDIGWFLISVVLVISPDSEEAVALALMRFKANIIGAVCSLIVLFIGLNGVFGVSIAFVMTIVTCYILGAASGGRAALAAVVIIMLHHQPDRLWETGLERVIAVAGGCGLGLTLTYAFHRDMWHKRKAVASSKMTE